MEQMASIPGYEGIYKISNHGRIFSIGRSNGHKRFSGELKAQYNARYMHIILCRDGRHRGFLVHRLVWMAFNGPISAGLEINHKNGDRCDNRLENLEAVTRLENTRHAYLYLDKASTASRGSKRPEAKLNEEQVKHMRQLRLGGARVKDIAEQFGIAEGNASTILSGKAWRHVT